MKKSTLRATAALQALALLGAGAGAAFIAAPAAAQDYTSGVITGTVTDESGNPVSGATVTLTSKQQGVTRTATSTGSGGFRFTGLQSGEYNVAVEAANNAGFQATDVRVLAGQTADLTIQLSSTEEIVVTGAQIQAFEGTTTGLNVDVEQLVKTVPIGRNLTSVVLLAPGTTQGDSAFGNLASIGGSSVAENAYYVNGLNTTNFDTYVGSATVPFEFYKSVEVKSGGYPAEYGRATGGIVNATTKSGTNDLKAALHLNWAPNFLQAHGKDLTTCSASTNPELKCQYTTDRHNDYAKDMGAIAELGGPIFRDRLFAYGILELRRKDTRTISRNGNSANVDRNNDPFYGFKVDAYPLDDHHFEFTLFSTRSTTQRQTFATTRDAGNNFAMGALTGTRNFEFGGTNYVGKYTGRFTDWLTLSAAYGRMRDRFDSVALDKQPAYIRNLSLAPLFGVAYGGYYTTQRAATIDLPYTTERKFWRGDADVYVSLFGDHHFRAGLDNEDDVLDHTAIRTGNEALCPAGFLTPAACNAGFGGAGAILTFQPTDATGLPIVEVNYYNSGGSFTSTNTAYYLQDEWKTPLEGLTVNLGIRRDDFTVKDPAGDTFVQLKKNYAPRVGFTYDIFPTSKGQIFGSYGTYYLPIASNTAFRAVGSEYYIQERYYVDPTTPFFTSGPMAGLPNITGQVTNNTTFSDNCVFGLTPYSDGTHCSQTGDGLPKDANFYLSKNLKPTKEAEWILGYRQRFMGLNGSISYTHRATKRLNEDASLDEAIVRYCQANGITGCESFYTTGSHQFAIINVGEDVTIDVDGGPLDGETITIPAELTGYPKVKRTYDAVDISVERPFDGKWSLGFNYTWSKSKGNSEGFVNSDIGQDDAGVTADFDFPGFTDNAYGYLPNDRRHKLKVFGAVALTDAFTLGGNFRLESPRHLSCFGFNPNSVFANNYNGPYNHYCNLEDAPRGKGNKTDWLTNIDLSGRYNISIPTGQVVTLRADVFNVLNSKAVQYRNEVGDSAAGYSSTTGLPISTTPNPNYGNPSVYQAPRSVRLGMDIEF